MNPQQLAFNIVQTLQHAGHTAYFAGGCVRDRVMNRAPKDYDVATSARPEQVLALFPRSQKVGVAFGVVIVRRGTAQVEVATFRSEGAYSDGRRPDSVTFTTPEIDAQRRDFTCNGLFLDPVADVIHDFVGGRADIAARTLRAIGDPHQRFGEDHLRLIRAVRFAAKLDFAIEPLTLAAITQLAHKITTISRERVGEELRMILAHPSRAHAVTLLRDTGLLAHIWPADALPPGAHTPGAGHRIAHLPAEVSRPLGLAAILRDAWPALPPAELPRIAGRLQEAFVLANHEREALLWLTQHVADLLDTSRWKRHITKKLLADPRWSDLAALSAAERAGKPDPDLESWADTLAAEGVAPPPMVTGESLINLGVPPGPQFKRWLEELYNRQLELEFPTPEAALAAARQLISQRPA